jgi:hypothetical protein
MSASAIDNVLLHESRFLAISRERAPKYGTQSGYTRKGMPALPAA